MKDIGYYSSLGASLFLFLGFIIIFIILIVNNFSSYLSLTDTLLTQIEMLLCAIGSPICFWISCQYKVNEKDYEDQP